MIGDRLESKTDRQVELIEDQEKKRKLRNCFIFETFLRFNSLLFQKKIGRKQFLNILSFLASFFFIIAERSHVWRAWQW